VVALQGFLVFLLSFVSLFLLPGLGITLLLFPHDDWDLFERLPLGWGLVLGLFLILFCFAGAFSWSWETVQRNWVVVIVLVLASAAAWRARAKHQGDYVVSRREGRFRTHCFHTGKLFCFRCQTDDTMD
jgi:hypothetical protein